jgi:hypothetical protein
MTATIRAGWPSECVICDRDIRTRPVLERRWRNRGQIIGLAHPRCHNRRGPTPAVLGYTVAPR